MGSQTKATPEITRAAERYLEQYGDPMVTNTYLKVTDAEMIALGLDGGVHDLVVEKLRRLWLPGNPPVVIVDQPAKKTELALLILNLNPYEIAKLPRECLDALLKLGNVSFDLCSQQSFHTASGKRQRPRDVGGSASETGR